MDVITSLELIYKKFMHFGSLCSNEAEGLQTSKSANGLKSRYNKVSKSYEEEITRLKEEGKVRIVLTISVISDWVFTSIFIR